MPRDSLRDSTWGIFLFEAMHIFCHNGFVNRGYTLIEIMVVIAISTSVAVMAFFGIRSLGNSQSVANAQLELISNLRSLQTQVYNGASGLNDQYILLQNNQSNYGVYDGSNTLLRTVSLPATVQLTGLPLPKLAICVANPSLSGYTAVLGGNSNCYSCGSGSYFACNSDGSSSTKIGSSGLTMIQIGLTNGSVTKYVNIEGSGMTVNRIYIAPIP